MPLNIKNPNVERLIDELAGLTGETKTEAVRKALEERRARLSYHISARSRGARLKRLLEHEVWPELPKQELGRRLSRREEETILGYGKEGV
jgi:antitoxin VapB